MSRQGSRPDPGSPLLKRIQSEFGSYEAWQKGFQAIGAMRGVGWAMLVHDPGDQRLFNLWIDEHNTGHLAGCQPVLTLDVFEHAYIRDYGLKRPDYIAAFMQAVDWSVAEGVFAQGASAAEGAGR